MFNLSSVTDIENPHRVQELPSTTHILHAVFHPRRGAGGEVVEEENGKQNKEGKNGNKTHPQPRNGLLEIPVASTPSSTDWLTD